MIAHPGRLQTYPSTQVITVSLIADLKGAELTFRYELEGEEPFVLSTKEVKEELGDTIPIDTPDVLIFIKDLIKENIKLSIGGFSL